MFSVNALRKHFAYTVWATERLLDSASKLSPEEVTRDFHTADRSVVGTLAHIYGGDRLWLARLRAAPPPPLVTDEDRKLAFLQNDWPALYAQWTAWLAGLDAEAPEREVAYVDTRGQSWRNPVWQVVMQVVNHGTHHRGQVSGFIRSLGYNPPPLDLMAYYRSQPKV